jgi:nucleoside 2-deoxyribosyltransferase/predicted secreted protein
MYVLHCPCIKKPALRADGITRPDDLAQFRRCIERCDRFGIEMVPLPCPETMYLGAGRAPGTFLERLDTPEFARLLDTLEERVTRIIEERGAPLALVGVNSSPTCGVTSTYYGSRGTEPPKRDGRGVFFARFPHIRAIDVAAFARYRVYLAAPLFSEAERQYNLTVAHVLKENFFHVFLPQENGDISAARDEQAHEQIYRANMRAIESADLIVAVIDGADADSGTAWEMGYATAKGKSVIALRTDFRQVGCEELVNLMLERSATVVRDKDALLLALSRYAIGKPGS